MTDPTLPARQASAMGQKHGLTCKYEYMGGKVGFVYRFYRRGCYIGSTSSPKQVLAKMAKFMEVK